MTDGRDTLEVIQEQLGEALQRLASWQEMKRHRVDPVQDQHVEQNVKAAGAEVKKLQVALSCEMLRRMHGVSNVDSGRSLVDVTFPKRVDDTSSEGFPQCLSDSEFLSCVKAAGLEKIRLSFPLANSYIGIKAQTSLRTLVVQAKKKGISVSGASNLKDSPAALDMLKTISNSGVHAMKFSGVLKAPSGVHIVNAKSLKSQSDSKNARPKPKKRKPE